MIIAHALAIPTAALVARAVALPIEAAAIGAGDFDEGTVGGARLAAIDKPIMIIIEIAHHEGAPAPGAAQFGQQHAHARPFQLIAAPVVRAAAAPIPAILRMRGRGERAAGDKRHQGCAKC
jgi:hypothetical protein